MHFTVLPWIMLSARKIRFSEVGSKQNQPAEQALMVQAVAVCIMYPCIKDFPHMTTIKAMSIRKGVQVESCLQGIKQGLGQRSLFVLFSVFCSSHLPREAVEKQNYKEEQNRLQPSSWDVAWMLLLQ